MSGSAKTTTTERRCSHCGLALPATAKAELCPKCLLLAGFRTAPLRVQAGAASRCDPALKGLPQPGEKFGRYRLVRLLGQGGMGTVYEAEDMDTGRRVALKLLSQALDSPEARAHFLREGQLAASINHPNSVYVFGTEEIAGTPVIAMELMPGGTLHGRIAASGPMPPAQAVDCILQVIAGLEAAQQIGILHRDIKPSNCFVDSDGVIKIGDFGLSIATSGRTEPQANAAGMVVGTPAFASPEQLHGDELTVSSDIYAVSGTLYYLLTGCLPFEASGPESGTAPTPERRAHSLAKHRAGLPRGLCRAVLRCLESDPRRRLDSYAKLRGALLPYATPTTAPASFSRRVAAGCIDGPLLFLLLLLLPTLHLAGWRGTAFFYGVVVLYFGALEGTLGASLGKLLLRLRVVRARTNRPDLPRAFFRVLVFVCLFPLTGDLISVLVFGITESNELKPEQTVPALCAMLVQMGLLLLPFVTLRKRNGFAIHDWLSGTRVFLVSKTAPLTRSASRVTGDTPPNLEAAPRLGPYHLLQKLEDGDTGTGTNDEQSPITDLAFDARLLRKVWIRQLPPGTPPVAPPLSRVGRLSRVRWLTGRRSATEAWDAYQAIEGRPFLQVIQEKQSWDLVRLWLLDVAAELEAAQRDGSMPAVLNLDRIWLGADGRAYLLDFPAPGVRPSSGAALSKNQSVPGCSDALAGSGLAAPEDGRTPTKTSPTAAAPGERQTFHDFLRQLALSALHGRPFSIGEAHEAPLSLPLALHARAFLDALRSAANPGEVVTRLKPLLHRRTTISRTRRLMLFLGTLSFPLFLTGVVLLFGDRQHLEEAADVLGLTLAYGIALVMLPGWLAALLFRGGALLHASGIAVARPDGRTASRGRLLWRNFLAFLPFLALTGAAVEIGFESPATATLSSLLLVLLAIITLVSILLPRSLQDRLAGTCLVPK